VSKHLVKSLDAVAETKKKERIARNLVPLDSVMTMTLVVEVRKREEGDI